MSKKPLEIDACVGSELRDSQGELLSVEGADITDLLLGRGRWNDNHSKGFNNTLGRITYAKKIFKAEDCDDERQRYYWEKTKSPYIYAKGYLFNNEDHENAKATAAILSNIHKTDAPLKVKASVEGGVISRGLRDSSYLARTKIHSVALTFTPANQATLVEPISLIKFDELALSDDLIKSILPMVQDNVPSFIDISNKMRVQKIANNINNIAEVCKSVINGAPVPKLSSNVVSGSGIGATRVHGTPQAPQEKQMLMVNRAKQVDAERREKLAGTKNFVPNHPSLTSAQRPTNVSGNSLSQNTIKTTPIDKWKKEQVLKQHAAKIANNPNHVDVIERSLALRGLSKPDIDRAIAKIQQHVPKTGERQPDGSIIKKSLCAGYGGAGAPTSLSGGGIIQKESVGLKSTSCPHCGEDQIYTKNQLKCRKCNKSFSMKKILELMS